MTHHDQSGHSHQHDEPPARHGFHRDWRVWLVVVLMLAAMLIYIFTLDEALQPGPPPDNAAPTAPAP